MQSADSGRSLFGALDYAPQIQTFVGNLDIAPSLDKLDKKVGQMELVRGSIPPPKALPGVDASKINDTFNKDLSIIDEAAKNPNLHIAHSEVVRAGQNVANRMKSGDYAAHEQSVKEYEDRLKHYGQLQQSGKVNSDEVIAISNKEKAKHDLRGGTKYDKFGAVTYNTNSPAQLVESANPEEFANKLHVNDFVNETGKYLEDTGVYKKGSGQDIGDYTKEVIKSGGVGFNRAKDYASLNLNNNPIVQKGLRQRAETEGFKLLTSNGYSQEEAAQVLANIEEGKGDVQFGDKSLSQLIAERENQLRNDFIDIGAKHLWKQVTGKDYTLGFIPQSSMKGVDNQIKNIIGDYHPTTPQENIRNISDLGISKEDINKFSFTREGKKQIYVDENGKPVRLTDVEVANDTHSGFIPKPGVKAKLVSVDDVELNKTIPYKQFENIQNSPVYDLYLSKKYGNKIPKDVSKIEEDFVNDFKDSNKNNQKIVLANYSITPDRAKDIAYNLKANLGAIKAQSSEGKDIEEFKNSEEIVKSLGGEPSKDDLVVEPSGFTLIHPEGESKVNVNFKLEKGSKTIKAVLPFSQSVIEDAKAINEIVGNSKFAGFDSEVGETYGLQSFPNQKVQYKTFTLPTPNKSNKFETFIQLTVNGEQKPLVNLDDFVANEQFKILQRNSGNIISPTNFTSSKEQKNAQE